jgi:hypothetical protein
MVGWQRDIDAMVVGSEVWSDGGWRCSEVRLWLRESEGEMRPKLNQRGRGKGCAGWLSPRRGDGAGGAAKFPVRGGSPMVGVDE